MDYISSVQIFRISGATVPQELTSCCCCCYEICCVLLIHSLFHNWNEWEIYVCVCCWIYNGCVSCWHRNESVVSVFRWKASHITPLPPILSNKMFYNNHVFLMNSIYAYFSQLVRFFLSSLRQILRASLWRMTVQVKRMQTEVLQEALCFYSKREE